MVGPAERSDPRCASRSPGTTAGPAARPTEPPVPGGNADLDQWWERVQPYWHLLYLGLLGLCGLVTVISDQLEHSQRWGSLALLCLMAALYLGLGWRLFERPGGPRAAVYLTGTWASFLGVLLLTDGATGVYFLLFALFAQIWAYLALPVAIVTSVLVVAAQTLVDVYIRGWGISAAGDSLLQGAFQTGLVLMMGLFVSGAFRQAERRAALIDELNATRSELAVTERARGVLAERERLANEIHDTLAQGFTSVLTLAQAIEVTLDRDPVKVRERLALLERTARENLAEARALVDALAPVDLQETPLPDAVARVAARFSAETGIPAEVTVDGTQPPMPVFSEIVLLRAVQEALTNVRKHARATQATVTLSFLDGEPGLASATVADDGVGFDPGAADGFGLHGMRNRAQQAGGGIEVTSGPGDGTVIRVHVPLQKAEL